MILVEDKLKGLKGKVINFVSGMYFVEFEANPERGVFKHKIVKLDPEELGNTKRYKVTRTREKSQKPLPTFPVTASCLDDLQTLQRISSSFNLVLDPGEVRHFIDALRKKKWAVDYVAKILASSSDPFTQKVAQEISRQKVSPTRQQPPTFAFDPHEICWYPKTNTVGIVLEENLNTIKFLPVEELGAPKPTIKVTSSSLLERINPLLKKGDKVRVGNSYGTIIDKEETPGRYVVKVGKTIIRNFKPDTSAFLPVTKCPYYSSYVPIRKYCLAGCPFYNDKCLIKHPPKPETPVSKKPTFKSSAILLMFSPDVLDLIFDMNDKIEEIEQQKPEELSAPLFPGCPCRHNTAVLRTGVVKYIEEPFVKVLWDDGNESYHLKTEIRRALNKKLGGTQVM